MPRFLASWTRNFIWFICSGVRYSGTPRPGETFTTKMPLAESRSRSRTILPILSLASGPFQLANGWMAPYSCGGALKLAAASRSDGTVSCCQGRCAGRTGASSGSMANVISTFFILCRLVTVGLLLRARAGKFRAASSRTSTQSLPRPLEGA